MDVNKLVNQRRKELPPERAQKINFSGVDHLAHLARLCDSAVETLDKYAGSVDVPVVIDELRAAVARLHAKLTV